MWTTLTLRDRRGEPRSVGRLLGLEVGPAGSGVVVSDRRVDEAAAACDRLAHDRVTRVAAHLALDRLPEPFGAARDGGHPPSRIALDHEVVAGVGALVLALPAALERDALPAFGLSAFAAQELVRTLGGTGVGLDEAAVDGDGVEVVAARGEHAEPVDALVQRAQVVVLAVLRTAAGAGGRGGRVGSGLGRAGVGLGEGLDGDADALAAGETALLVAAGHAVEVDDLALALVVEADRGAGVVVLDAGEETLAAALVAGAGQLVLAPVRHLALRRRHQLAGHGVAGVVVAEIPFRLVRAGLVLRHALLRRLVEGLAVVAFVDLLVGALPVVAQVVRLPIPIVAVDVGHALHAVRELHAVAVAALAVLLDLLGPAGAQSEGREGHDDELALHRFFLLPHWGLG